MKEKVEQERTISGKGVFRLNDDFRECKRIILYASVIRPPKSSYLNVTWNPGRGFYANISLSYEGYVGVDVAMNFPEQMFIIHENDSQQLGASLVCALDNILDSFVQYAIASGIPYIKNNSIEDFAYSAFVYEEAKFVCYSGCAISLRLVGEKTEKCDPADAPSDYPPPPPPPSQQPVPPGTPVEVDSPYPDEPPQNPDTDPDPIDNPPTPSPCAQFGLKYRIVSAQYPSPGLEATQPFEGEYEGIEVVDAETPGNVNLGFRAGQTVNGQCVGGFYYALFTNLEQPYEFEVLEILSF